MNASAPPKGHDRYEALAVAWAIDALEPADQVIFEEHQDGCDDCALTILATLEVATELAYGVPDIEPPAQLRRRILAAAGPRPPVQGTSPESTPRHRAQEPADLGGPAGFAALDLFGDPYRTRGTEQARGTAPTNTNGSTNGTGTNGTGSERGTPGTNGTGPSGATGTATAGTGTGTATAGTGTGSATAGTGIGAATAGTEHAYGAAGAEGATAQKPRGGSRPPVHRRPSGLRLGPRSKSAPGRDERRGARSGTRRRRIVSVLAAAALVGISAVTTWEVTRPAAVTAPTAAAERTATLSRPTGEGAVATVVVRAGKADVVTDALPANTGTTEFYLWGVPAGGAGMPQVVGMFQVTTSGLHSYPVHLTTRSLENYPVLAISQELAGSSPIHPSSVIARGAFGR